MPLQLFSGETSGSVNSAIECGVVMISIPIPIVVVISKALVLQHGRLAKNNTCKFTQYFNQSLVLIINNQCVYNITACNELIILLSVNCK